MTEPELNSESGLDSEPEDRYGDRNLTLDVHEDDWAWRRKLRANPQSLRLYRLAVGLVGAVIVAGGLVMIPFPGPGWLVVFLGIGVWASEFKWAARLLNFGKRTLKSWNEWLKVQPWWVQGLVVLVTAAAVALIFYVLFLISGVPGFLPNFAENWLHSLPGL